MEGWTDALRLKKQNCSHFNCTIWIMLVNPGEALCCNKPTLTLPHMLNSKISGVYEKSSLVSMYSLEGVIHDFLVSVVTLLIGADFSKTAPCINRIALTEPLTARRCRLCFHKSKLFCPCTQGLSFIHHRIITPIPRIF